MLGRTLFRLTIISEVLVLLLPGLKKEIVENVFQRNVFVVHGISPLINSP
ncbi:hypothetical protein XBFFL1_1700001 [Xenorhabdus bovienii str. feltiae Florida]|nr:hypothetical protein XBFFR1_600008 [Xenorhabdus bovienii str. feltiae France]CDG91683.1 hypothetical protein XBFFL1_1700001 [Xenorhabdus bovienii str. feltiae Florida]